MWNISGRALRRRTFRRLNGKSPEARMQPIEINDAGYRTLTHTKGWKQVSGKRLRAGQVIATIFEKGERIKAMVRFDSPAALGPRNDNPSYRKQAADRQFGLFLPAVAEQPVKAKRASGSKKAAQA